jgi:DNA helicase II / ATP-dependent DNA helicase PcrA
MPFNKFLGPTIVLAGPGTGKTTYLVKRSVDLIKSLDENAKGICISTFTRKAAEELQHRLSEQLSVKQINKVKLLVGTIHSLCFELLTQYSSDNYGDFEILSEDSQVQFIFSKLANLGFSPDYIKGRGWVISEELCTVFNKITDEGIDVSSINFGTNEKLEDYCNVYSTYKRLLDRERLFDFATIQELFLKEMNSNPEFKKNIRDDYSYFLIDEYQDVNNIQDNIFKSLSSPEFNLTVVGDDDQSIYAFRGSNVEYIQHFTKWFQDIGVDCKTDILSVNYRSTRSIVALSNEILTSTKYSRVNKNLRAKSESKSALPVAEHFDSDIDEAQFICDSIRELYDLKIINSYSEVGILFRSVKNHAKPLIQKMMNENLPYNLFGGGNLFDKPIGAEFLNILNFYLARDKDKEQIFWDGINTLDAINHTNITEEYVDNSYTDKLNDLFASAEFQSCIDLTYQLFIATNFIERYENEGPNLGILTSTILNFDDFSDYYDPFALYGLLSYLRRSKKLDFITNNKFDGVEISTIHQSKGLEYPIVFIPSQNKRNRMKSIIDDLSTLTGRTSNNEDDELRLFYVGCTRAEDFLSISGSKRTGASKKDYSPSTSFGHISDSDYIADQIDFDSLKNSRLSRSIGSHKKNIQLSYNKIRTYEFCPLAYKYSYVWNLKTVRIGGLEYGSNIHKILEVILKAVKNGHSIDKIDVDNVINSTWRNTHFRSAKENLKYKAAATKQIKLFVSNNYSALVPEKIFSVEEKFNILVNDTVITGRFDLVLKNQSTALLIDFKTGDEKDYSSQLSFYSLCFKQKYDGSNLELAIYYLKSGSQVSVQANDESIELNKIRHVTKMINDEIFPATPGKHCSDCSFTSVCKDSF